MTNNSRIKVYDEKILPDLIKQMKKDPELEGFTEDELTTILLKMKIFQVGLSVMVANGSLPKEYKIQDLMCILSSVADDAILSVKLSKTISSGV